MTKKFLTSLALTAALLTIAGSTQAQSVRLAVGPESKLWIEGGSNLHDWSCKASSIDAAIDVDEAFFKTHHASRRHCSRKSPVKVPVRNLKCGHGGMDNNLYKALKADDSPEISYILATFDVVPAATSDSFTVKTVGALTVAGTEKTVNMDVTAARLPDGGVTRRRRAPAPDDGLRREATDRTARHAPHRQQDHREVLTPRWPTNAQRRSGRRTTLTRVRTHTHLRSSLSEDL